MLPLVCIRKDFENHRTATEYEDSLIFKLFCFTFCNSYGGFIYLAFIGEPVIGIECEYSCVSLLATNLTIVFGVQLVVGIINDLVLYKFQEFSCCNIRERIWKELTTTPRGPL